MDRLSDTTRFKMIVTEISLISFVFILPSLLILYDRLTSLSLEEADGFGFWQVSIILFILIVYLLYKSIRIHGVMKTVGFKDLLQILKKNRSNKIVQIDPTIDTVDTKYSPTQVISFPKKYLTVYTILRHPKVQESTHIYLLITILSVLDITVFLLTGLLSLWALIRLCQGVIEVV